MIIDRLTSIRLASIIITPRQAREGGSILKEDWQILLGIPLYKTPVYFTRDSKTGKRGVASIAPC